MVRSLGKLAIAAGLVLVALAAVTWAALESGGVGVVHTRSDTGAERATHVWPVRVDGDLWLEAGTPDHGWYRDVLRDPRVELEWDGVAKPYRAEPAIDSARHREVRSSLRARYGWRDRWVGLFVDASRSRAVRLVPVGAGGAAAAR